MSTKTERNAQAYEQLTAVLTAVDRPMTVHEIANHQMIRPLEASTRSLGQWLKYMQKTGTVSRTGTGKRAKYLLASQKAAKAVKAKAQLDASDSVVIRVSTGGFFRSVQAPAGVTVSLEFVA